MNRVNRWTLAWLVLTGRVVSVSVIFGTSGRVTVELTHEQANKIRRAE